jgi:2-polyprenylphenol 6-hydroxylase
VTSADASFDVAIVGAGLVGASLACALAPSGLRCALVDGALPAPPLDTWDTRVYAISPSSQAFLRSIGAWKRLDPARLAPIYAMRVFGDGSSELSFSAYDSGVERLATIVESGALQRTLWEFIANEPAVQVYCPAKPESMQIESDHVRLQLVRGPSITSRVVVGADGTNSWVRETAGFPVRERSGESVGVVANFACEKAHRGAALQWFRQDGVLAWLPLPGNHFSIVWTTDRDTAAALMNADAQALSRRVGEAGHHALGELSLVTSPAAFPVRRFHVPRRVRPRLALIGDAAHAVHPLAGQGVNLGFGDACALSTHLRHPGADPGDVTTLRQFERDRAEDILAMRFATEGLQKLYSVRGTTAARVRGAGLKLTDRSSVLKNLLARRAMGSA